MYFRLDKIMGNNQSIVYSDTLSYNRSYWILGFVNLYYRKYHVKITTAKNKTIHTRKRQLAKFCLKLKTLHYSRK